MSNFFNNNSNNSNNSNNEINNDDLNNLYNTTYDPNNDPTRDFTAGSSNSNGEAFKVLMGSTNDIRDQKPDNSELLLEDYIGENSRKIINGKFNLFAFLFNIFYVFYRKLFGIGILLSLIVAGLSYLTSIFIIWPLIALASGFGFNFLYVMYAKHRIKKIESEHPDASYEQLRSYVQSEGGTNSNLVAKGIFADIFLGILIIVILITLGVGTTWNKLLSDFNFKEILSIFKKNETKETEFYGRYAMDSSIDPKDYFTFTLPNGYKKTSNTEYTNNSCKLLFNSVKDYKAADILIGSMQKYYKKIYNPNNKDDYVEGSLGELEIKTYNKTNWEGFYKIDKNSYNYFYATDYKDKVFMIELVNMSSNSECINDLNQLLQTIETK